MSRALAIRLAGHALVLAITAGLWFGWAPLMGLFRGSWLNDLRMVIGAVAIILLLSALDWLWTRLLR